MSISDCRFFLTHFNNVLPVLAPFSTAQNAVARAATRIALYMMREENEHSDVGKFPETQHAHDFFVVNSCKASCTMIVNF